jgi:predicted enzyme related to lactoylglutathione lyase
MEEALSWARGRGCVEAQLNTLVGNPARALFASLGFREVESRMTRSLSVSEDAGRRPTLGPTPPLGRLEYVYLGSGDFDRDLAWYRDVAGAELVWNFSRFGACVAAFRVGDGAPLTLIADHRPPGTCRLVYAVLDLKATVHDLRARGWKPEAGPFEIPNGPCYTFCDPSGNAFGQRPPGRWAIAHRAQVPRPLAAPAPSDIRGRGQALPRARRQGSRAAPERAWLVPSWAAPWPARGGRDRASSCRNHSSTGRPPRDRESCPVSSALASPAMAARSSSRRSSSTPGILARERHRRKCATGAPRTAVLLLCATGARTLEDRADRGS